MPAGTVVAALAAIAVATLAALFLFGGLSNDASAPGAEPVLAAGTARTGR